MGKYTDILALLLIAFVIAKISNIKIPDLSTLVPDLSNLIPKAPDWWGKKPSWWGYDPFYFLKTSQTVEIDPNTGLIIIPSGGSLGQQSGRAVEDINRLLQRVVEEKKAIPSVVEEKKAIPSFETPSFVIDDPYLKQTRVPDFTDFLKTTF